MLQEIVLIKIIGIHSVDVIFAVFCMQAVFKNPILQAQAGENLKLQILFFKLCHYLRSPVTLVFVFDGPHRPSVKCGQTVPIHHAHLLTEHAKKLITAFRYYFHQMSCCTNITN